jgi:hypothetical protein
MLDSAQVLDVLSLILWWLGLALEFVILIRAVRTRMLTRYPYFYAYVVCVFVVSAGLYLSLKPAPDFYRRWYWPTQFVTLLMGCGVILEIVEHALESYAGARRFLRSVCLGIIAAMMLYAGMKLASGAPWDTFMTSAAMERDLRAVEAIILAAVLLVISYYRICLGKNAKGLLLGLGAYVAISLIALSIYAAFGAPVLRLSGTLQSGSYLFAVAVWTAALWSYAPNPVPPQMGRMGTDYDQLADETREKLEALRSHFNRAAQP